MIEFGNTQELSNTAIIALTLVVSEKSIKRLSEVKPMYSIAQKVIEAGWSWMKSRSPNPEQMYWADNPVLMEMDSDPKYHALYEQKPYIQYAFGGVIYTHYLVVCYSEATERLENPENEYSIGNDIAEVNDEFVTICLNNFIKSSERPDKTKVWIRKVVDKLLLENNRSLKGYSGDSISKDFFINIPY